MPTTYNNPVYPYRRARELDAGAPRHCPVVIVGGGPSGLAAAVDLAQQGVASVVLDDNNTVSVGSRAICFAKRTLEINPKHPAIANMGELLKKNRDAAELKEWAHFLVDYVLLAEGRVEEPQRMMKAMQSMMSLASEKILEQA